MKILFQGKQFEWLIERKRGLVYWVQIAGHVRVAVPVFVSM